MKKTPAGKVRTPAGNFVPKNYVQGLTGAARTKRLRELDEMREKGKKLGPLTGDKTPKGKAKKLPKSKHTKAFEKRYGKTK